MSPPRAPSPSLPSPPLPAAAAAPTLPAPPPHLHHPPPHTQVELRVLAHLSGDPELVALLLQAGPEGDAFKHIASTWLGSGGLPTCLPACLPD